MYLFSFFRSTSEKTKTKRRKSTAPHLCRTSMWRRRCGTTVDDQGGVAMRGSWVGIRIVLIVLGGLGILQGVGLLGGSVMAGQTFWAIVGVIFLIVGSVLC